MWLTAPVQVGLLVPVPGVGGGGGAVRRMDLTLWWVLE